MTVPLLDLQAQFTPMREEVLHEVTRVIDSQRFILGPDVEALEKDIAPYCGAKYAIGCANGTDALFLALLAHGIGHGDPVITTPYTFFATAGAISRIGARPVFVDIDPKTFNLDANQLEIVLRANPEAKAILPVHLYGGAADMDPICKLATERGIPVIEDAAQAIGSEYKGRRVGSIGSIGCFSFFPSKNLGGFGDGGLLTTNDKALADKLMALRVHGTTGVYMHEWVGINSRLDALQAAVLRIKLRHLDAWSEGRRRNAELYRELLEDAPVQTPVPVGYQTRHIYNQFIIRVENRDNLKSYLGEQGIGTAVYYPLPLHLQNCFSYLGYRAGDFPESEKASKETLALPIFAELTREQIEYVSQAIRTFYQ
ncbi:MAG: DegT/DnrJ/EryC1/StrS family aminotransferase [Bryobacteraceae bacterium]